ncbi:MAG: OmpA family protein [Nannocystis sp.]|jgi:chemotaxis protein MotB|nr:OmpA family protein [Nannocystis sp.]
MRRALLALLIPAVLLSGCKRKELEAALDEANKKLSATEQALDAEKAKNKQLQSENQSLQAKIAELEGSIKQLESQIDDLARKAGMTAQELEELRKEKAKRLAELQVYKDLFGRLKSLVDAGTIQVEFRKGMLVVKLASAILFDSGKTELKGEGQQALTDLSVALKTVGDREFLVAGHTDNIPIKTARFKSNWELSTSRAIEVVRYMVEQGMDPVHIAPAGFGEFDPVSDNGTEEGRALNRRIEIILMPKLGDIPGMKEMLMGGKKS